MTLYSVTAATEQHTVNGVIHRTVPCFLLNSSVQGIMDERHAEEIARQIINPVGHPCLKVFAHAERWRDV